MLDHHQHPSEIANLLVSVQQGIFSLAPSQIPSIVANSKQLFLISEIEDVNCIANNIFKVYSIKNGSLSFIIHLVQDMIASFNQTLSRALCESFLDIAFQYDSVFFSFSTKFSDLILLSHFIQSGILTPNEVVERASSYVDFPSENASYPALIFSALAPEIKSVSESLFTKFYRRFNECMAQNYHAVFFDEIYKKSKHLFSEDFLSLKNARTNGFIDNSLDEIFMKDDIDALHKEIASGWNPNEHIVSRPFQKRLNICRLLPVEYAASLGSKKCTIKLLETANILEINVEGHGILHYAIAGGNLDLVKTLHEKGVSLDGALHFSVMYFQSEITTWLLENGRNFNEDSLQMGSVLNSALISDNLSALREFSIDSISLHTAASSNSISSVRFLLLSDGVDANVKNQNQETPVHTAALLSRTNSIKSLLRSPNVDVNAKIETKQRQFILLQQTESLILSTLSLNAESM
jgi:ankyrin repeat protein